MGGTWVCGMIEFIEPSDEVQVRYAFNCLSGGLVDINIFGRLN